MKINLILISAALSFSLTSFILAGCIAPAPGPVIVPPAPIVVPPAPTPGPGPGPIVVPPPTTATVSEWPVVEAVLARYTAGERWTRAQLDTALGTPFQKPYTQVDAPNHHVVSWHYKAAGGEVQNLHVHFQTDAKDALVALMEQG